MITRLRKSGIAIGIVAGLMMFSGLALAAEHEDEPEGDTLLVVGFDAGNGILVTGISNVLSGAWDCKVPAPEDPGEDPLSFDVTYGPEDTDGNLPVDSLIQGGEVDQVGFGEGPGADPAPDLPIAYPTPYPEATDCALTGTPVGDEDGKINHGKVVSTFGKLLKGPYSDLLDEYNAKKGCLMRLVAHTDFGKGEQQVKPAEIDPDIEPTIVDGGTLTLENMLTRCQKPDKAEKAPKDNPGQLKKADRLAEGAAPGNSGNAKGKNKDK